MSGNGNTYNDLDIRGRVLISATASNTTFNRCRIRGYQISGTGGESSNALLLATPNGSTNTVLNQCTLIPDYPAQDWDAVLGHDVKLYRCLLAHYADGWGMYNTGNPGGPVNNTMDSCFVGYAAFFSPAQSSNASDSTHNDGIQILGGTNIRIVNNTILGYISMPDGIATRYSTDPFGYVGQGGLTVAPTTGGDNGTGYNGNVPYNQYYPSGCGNSGIQFNQTQGTLANVLVDNNWFAGGIACLNVAVTFGANSYITNNKFARDMYLGPTYAILGSGGATVSGNVHEDDGSPVSIH